MSLIGCRKCFNHENFNSVDLKVLGFKQLIRKTSKVELSKQRVVVANVNKIFIKIVGKQETF